MLKAGKLSHLIKELKEGSGKEQPKTEKKGETSGKDKALAILMRRRTLRFILDEFHGLKITSPYNGIIGRLRVKKLQAVPSTAHEMLKILVEGGITVAINPEHPHQTVMISSTLIEEGHNRLCNLLQRNLDTFAWKPADMTGIPRHIAEHYLNVRERCFPIRQRKQGQAADRIQAIHKEVEKLVEARIMKEVDYHNWLSNLVMVKKHDGSRRIDVLLLSDMFRCLKLLDIKCVLSQKPFSAFCEKFHILDEVHHVLPNQDNTIHERPVGKIGLYTRFFDFANFRLPLSTFLIDILRDPSLKVIDFNAQDYAALVAHPFPFQKFPEEFLCLVRLSRHYTLDEDTYPLFADKDEEDMDIFAFIHTLDPTKASVDKLFDEGGSGTQAEQGDFVSGGGGQGINIQLVAKTMDIVAEDVVLTLSEVSIRGKSRSVVQLLLAGAVHNVEVKGDPIPTLTFVTSSVSATPECEGESHTDYAEVDSFDRPSVSVITVATTVTLTIDPAIVIKEKIVKPSLFSADSTSTGGIDPAIGGFTDLSGSDFLIGGIRIIISPDTDLQKVYVPKWSITNGSRLDDGRVFCEIVDEFATPKFFASIRKMEHDQLFTKFNVGAARQMSLSVEVRMHAKYNIKEKRRLAFVVEEKNQLMKSRDEEIKNLKAQLLLKEAEAVEAIRLCAEASHFEVTEKSLWDEVNTLNGRNTILEKEHNALDVKSQNDDLADQVHELQDAQLKVVNDKFDKLYADFVEMTLTWRKVSKLVEYLSAFGLAVSKAIKKGMQDGLAADITHGRKGHALADVAAHNPSAKADYVSTLQQLQSLNESQPHANQLMVPIHHSPDKTIVGASALSLALDVSDARVRRIKENIMSHRSLFQEVFIPLAEPFSAAALTGVEGTSDVVPATVDITTVLSIPLASAGIVIPIFIDDYGVMGTDDQLAMNENVVGENADPFPNVDDAELNIL
nr:reverse transcriptase domain-containing protein [Tanacetum cinerariifolium]